MLYLLRTTHRAENNPCLEVALRAASQLDRPLVCLAVVEDSFPLCMRSALHRSPTDRAAAFRLEALRELQPAFAARGAALYIHVERDGCRAAVAMSLAAKACLVIADDHFGVEPHATAAARVAKTGAPLWLCDAATTVPSTTIAAAALNGGNAGFLRATAAARTARLNPGWFPPPEPPPRRPPPDEPPAWSVDLAAAGAVDAILAAPSRRDVAVGRLHHTRGGPRAALARWTSYVQHGGLRSYASNRNNPLASDNRGASRMSAYINLGMIDPTRIARDAQAAGATKFLAEFVGFRESAHLWCLRHPRGYSDASVAVPAWGQSQLRSTKLPAPALAALESGRTGDAPWDDCQRALVTSGELHNNVRMAWGKAIPGWHAAALPPAVELTPATRLQAALDLLIHLNDKYALDGGAPPSYGGLLWCLGWRDRPGKHGAPKPRPTSVIARRVKPGALERRAQSRVGGRPASPRAAAASTAASVGAGAGPASEAAATGERRKPSDSSLPPGKRAKTDATPKGGAGTLWQYLDRGPPCSDGV